MNLFINEASPKSETISLSPIEDEIIKNELKLISQSKLADDKS